MVMFTLLMPYIKPTQNMEHGTNGTCYGNSLLTRIRGEHTYSIGFPVSRGIFVRVAHNYRELFASCGKFHRKLSIKFDF